jgi:peptide/nickel transport system permease protein
MQKYMVRRLLLTVPTILGVTILIFVAMRVLPGDPVEAMFSGELGATTVSDEEKRKVEESLGLHRPLLIQYTSWIADILKGDFGNSFWRPEPIREVFERRAPITGQIALFSIVFSWIVGLPVAVVSAMRRNSALDYASRFLVTLFMAVPSFLVGITIVTVGVLFFTWRPPLTIEYLWDDPVHNLQITVIPALVLGVSLGALIARMARATILEVLREDYVRTGRAKGLEERVVVWRHVLKNAMLPVITVSGLHLASLLGGSVAVEVALGVPGLGRSLVQAMDERDWMLIQNLVLLYAALFVFVNLAIDLAYGWIDPRIRYQ